MHSRGGRSLSTLNHVASHVISSATAAAVTVGTETMNDWAQKTPLSPTLAIKDTADEMRAAGTVLFDFGIGETNPEVPVPDIIKQTIASSTMDEENHYSPAQGDPALLDAISEDLGKNFDIPTSVDQLCVCPGPKDAIFKAAMAMTNGRSHRRRFVCFAPIYESFISIPLLVGGEQPLVLSTDPKTFLPDPAELRAALEANDDICCVIVNSPNNPTGAIYPKELLAEIARVIKDFPEVWALSDEVYRTVRFVSGRHASLRQFLPDQTVSVSGMSKEVSGTGLRLGFCAGPLNLIALIRSIQSNSSSCVNLPTQRAYEMLIRHDIAHNMELRSGVVAQLQSRQKRLLTAFDAALERHPAVGDAMFAHVAQGAFYWFPNIQGILDACASSSKGEPIVTDADLANHLLSKANVVALPGSEFGAPGYMRLAYCVPMETIDAGIAAMIEELASLLEAAKSK